MTVTKSVTVKWMMHAAYKGNCRVSVARLYETRVGLSVCCCAFSQTSWPKCTLSQLASNAWFPKRGRELQELQVDLSVPMFPVDHGKFANSWKSFVTGISLTSTDSNGGARCSFPAVCNCITTYHTTRGRLNSLNDCAYSSVFLRHEITPAPRHHQVPLFETHYVSMTAVFIPWKASVPSFTSLE